MTPTITISPRCHVALELSRSRWLVGALLPGRAKVALHTVPGGDAQGLLALLRRIEARASAEIGMRVPAVVCFEAGYDGFWLARLLRQHGVETHVLDAASILVSRRGRRTKTDRLDVEAMALVLRPFCNRVGQ
jgi:transposase